jgi:hypothetical protein
MKPADKLARREARLAERLKANLARRKDQARSREPDAPIPLTSIPPHPDPLPKGEREKNRAEKENPSS